MDVTSRTGPQGTLLSQASTVPGSVSLTLGGVGRNVAEAAHRILTADAAEHGSSTMLVAPVGQDTFGRLLIEETGKLGMRTDGLLQSDAGRTAVCNIILDDQGDLITGIADMDIIQYFDVNQVKQNRIYSISPSSNVFVRL